jgi:dihydrofolate reductase
MANVVIDIAMSLDGYVTGPNDRPEKPMGENRGERIFGWDASDRQILLEAKEDKIGAMITGRRTYDITNGWNGTHPIRNGIPVFVLAETAPSKVPEGNTPFTFVTDGIESAVEQAKAAAGEKIVYVIGGGNVIQQLLNKGLADELRVHISSAFIGGGTPLFASLDPNIKLEQTEVKSGRGVVHLTYRLHHP